MRKIAPTMVSQHPDHAGKPYWHDKEFISTRDESLECFLTYSDLHVMEYKWDWEGKYVDESVVERLISEHYDYFQKNQIGKDVFLTFRLPNPKVETEFRLGRAFMGILGAANLSKQLKLHSPPLFEVILPMTESAEEMISIQEAFHELASLRHPLYKLELNGLKHIQLIPLFEQVSTIINSDKILEKYLDLYQNQFASQPAYIRPYVARSDPALNSGIVPTVLGIKIALSKYLDFEKKHNIKLYPVIGSASLPFRGGLTPHTAKDFANEYKGVKTALIQSAFRYDYDIKDVKKGLNILHTLLPKNEAEHISEKDISQLETIISVFEKQYRKSIPLIAPLVNEVSSKLPKRRERVQHVGLFGYSRGIGKVRLPRAIGFTAAMYSIGVPPELVGTGRGLHLITKKNGNIELLKKYYKNIISDLERAGTYLNKEVVNDLAKDNGWEDIQKDVEYIEDFIGHKLGPVSKEEKKHEQLTSKLYQAIKEKKEYKDLIPQAALLRKSMG